ncbi:MAG: hypothetical protein ACXWBQ_14220 [Usitatibacter sp.]
MRTAHPRRGSAALPADAFLAWMQVGMRTLEMLAASARVIHHRTHRRNTPAQLFEMGNEKVQAAIESSHAMARHWLSVDAGAGGPFNHWAALVASAVEPFHARALGNARRMRRR